MELGNFRNYFSCIFNPFGTFYIEKNTVNMFKSAAEIFTFCILFENRDELYFASYLSLVINIVIFAF
jgi:hypothetical protein